MKVNKLKNNKDMEVLFLEMGSDIYRYIYYRTGQRKELAEDLTEDVFMKIWVNKEKFDEKKSSLKSWVYAIAHNYVIDYYRKNKLDDISLDSIRDYEGVEENKDKDLLIETIKNRLKDLKTEEQEVIVLRYINEISIDEISKVIGKKNSATKVMIHRAIQHLKKIVNKND